MGRILSKLTSLPVLIGVLLAVVVWYVFTTGLITADFLPSLPSLSSPSAPGSTPSPERTGTPSERQIPGAGVARQLWQSSEEQRTSVWEMFKYEFGIGTFMFPLYAWLIFLLIIAAAVLPIALWSIRKIAGEGGIEIEAPDKPVNTAIKLGAMAAIGWTFFEVCRRYGVIAGIGVGISVIGEYAVLTDGWPGLKGTVRKLGATRIVDWMGLLVSIGGLIGKIVALIIATILPFATSLSFVSAELQPVAAQLAPNSVMVAVLTLTAANFTQFILVGATALMILYFVKT